MFCGSRFWKWFLLTQTINSMSDSSVFQQIRKGDETAFNHLFDEYYASLCFFAAKYLNDLDLSRSLVQQVFIDLWVKRKKIEIDISFKSYLYRSVKNRCIDYLRKEKKVSCITENIDGLYQISFTDLVEEAELKDLINRLINQLPPKCRKIFLLCRFEGLKYGEIAQELRISVKTVEMQMGIAMKKLREKLKDY